MKRMNALMLVLLGTVFLLPATGRAVDKKYNIVLITADALRADRVGAYGNEKVRTPHIDALAAQGTLFERAYTAITTTTPSHASLFSSVSPEEHRAFSNTARISDDIVMLPEILKAKGWHTAAIVNLPWLNPEISNIPQGIDEFARCDHIRKADETNRWVLPFFDSRAGKSQPFYLWVHYIDNHTPYYAPGKYARMYYPKDRDPNAGSAGSLQKAWKFFPDHHRDNKYIKKWLRGITDADYVVASYDGSASWLDLHIGQLVDSLKKNGLWERTIFVFTSDHGESLGEHHLWFLHGGLFETTAKVPLIVRVPGEPQGRRVSTVVQLVDVMPTLLTRLGLPVPEKLRGRDLWPLGQQEDPSGGAAYVAHAGRQLEALVTRQYKFIRHLKTRSFYPGYAMRKGKVELYDLQADPGELHNLAPTKPELAKRLRGYLDKMRRLGKVKFSEEKAKIDEQTEEMLRSLGYTE